MTAAEAKIASHWHKEVFDFIKLILSKAKPTIDEVILLGIATSIINGFESYCTYVMPRELAIYLRSLHYVIDTETEEDCQFYVIKWN